MPSYKYVNAFEVILPDIPLVVSPGDVVDLPAGFWSDDDQATAAGFEPTASTPTATAAPAVDAPQE